MDYIRRRLLVVDPAAFFFDGDTSPEPDGSNDDSNPAIWQGICSVEDFAMMPTGTPGRRVVPTHTEDGIPIRKIYISNLPYKTTRKDLFEMFAQYGFIKSCWVKNSDRTSNILPYGFITYSDPADAHKALQAPNYKHSIKGRFLRVSPADSWHQPIQDANGQIIWNTKKSVPLQVAEEKPSQTETSTHEAECSSSQEAEVTAEPEYNMMDILNPDCLSHVLSYLSVMDLIRTEAVSKRWRDMVQDHLLSFRSFQTSSWHKGKLTTAQLRQLLARFGPSLTTLNIDSHYLSLNDRTAHIIGQFCPNLAHLNVMGMLTKNWKPVIYSCKDLKSIGFYECEKMEDKSISSLLGPESSIESITVSTNSIVKGKFLENLPPKLHALTLHRCNAIQPLVLMNTLPKCSHLKYLNLSSLGAVVWVLLPDLLSLLTQLEELHLCSYIKSAQHIKINLNEALGKLSQLTTLVMRKNLFVNDNCLEFISKSLKKLRKLDISACSYIEQSPSTKSEDHVTITGLTALAKNCSELRTLNISQVEGLDEGIGALTGSELECLVATENFSLSDTSLIQCITGCHQLQNVDVSGCDGITSEIVTPCVAELERRPRPLKLNLGRSDIIYDLTLILMCEGAGEMESEIRKFRPVAAICTFRETQCKRHPVEGEPVLDGQPKHPMLTISFEYPVYQPFSDILREASSSDEDDDEDDDDDEYGMDDYGDLFSGDDFSDNDFDHDDFDEDDFFNAQFLLQMRQML